MSRIDLLEKIDADIDTHGISVMGIFPTDEDEEPSSPFNYTVGMREVDQPEVIICGLDLRVGHWICNEIYRRVKEEGLTIQPGDVLEGLVGGPYKAYVCRVTDDHEANMARNKYGDDVEVVQIVLPDLNNKFPWDEGYDQDPLIQKYWFIAPETV